LRDGGGVDVLENDHLPAIALIARCDDGPMSEPRSEVRVRVAGPADATAIARVQVAAWRERYADLLPADLVDAMDADAFAARWEQSLHRPGDARNRVLVALDGDDVRGFAVTGPATDPDADPIGDGEIAELVVEPSHRRRGHGSRLLQAAVETLRSDRFTRGILWLAGADDDARRFVADAGWAPDGAHRELDLRGDGAVRVKQVRLHTALGDPD
jgi:GNAT superfamily N-acetyltransferase